MIDGNLIVKASTLTYGATDMKLKRMLCFPPRLCFSMNNIEEVVKYLFLTHTDVIFPCDSGIKFNNFTLDELHSVCSKVKNNKAPGCIRPEIIKAVILENLNYVLRVYNILANDTIFPAG